MEKSQARWHGGAVAQAIIPALGRWTQEGQLGVQGHFQPQVSSQPGLSEILSQKTKEQTKSKSSDWLSLSL